MRELPDRWILPLAGHTVTRCCIDGALSIQLSDADSAEGTIQITGPFDLQRADTLRHLRPDGDPTALAPALALLGLTVDHAEAIKDGTLNLTFRDGSRLRVPPDPDYEAWEFTGQLGAKVVALPGGDIAVWCPAA